MMISFTKRPKYELEVSKPWIEYLLGIVRTRMAFSELLQRQSGFVAEYLRKVVVWNEKLSTVLPNDKQNRGYSLVWWPNTITISKICKNLMANLSGATSAFSNLALEIHYINVVKKAVLNSFQINTSNYENCF